MTRGEATQIAHTVFNAKTSPLNIEETKSWYSLALALKELNLETYTYLSTIQGKEVKERFALIEASYLAEECGVETKGKISEEKLFEMAKANSWNTGEQLLIIDLIGDGCI